MISMKRFILTLLCFLCFGIAFGNEPSVVSGDYIIDDWKINISEEGTISIMEYKGSSENVAIPDNFDGFPVVSIGQNAFQKKDVVSVTIPDSVTLIGWGAFSSCYKLKSVVIGKSLETISESAFSYCKSLEKIVIPDSVKKIKAFAFRGCENLTSVDFGNSLEEIGNEAFYCCSSLTSVDFGNSLEEIGNEAFNSCSSLTSVVIPDSVTYIGDYAFSNCESLTDFTIGKSVLSFNYSGIFDSHKLHTITLKNAGTDLINVPSSVQVIKPKAKSLREQMQERNDK